MTPAALIPAPATCQGVGCLTPAAEQAREFARRARSRSTLKAYKTDWADFERWCERQPATALPATPETVACYISSMAEFHKASTITRRLSAISQLHQVKGFESPTKNEMVRSVLKGIRRTIGTTPDEKAPLVAADIREMVGRLPDTTIGIRDRALLLLGFAGAFRRSELVGLNVEDLEFTDDGLVVILRKSKTDQERQGRKIGVPCLPASDACPVRAVRAWMEKSGIAAGPLFRSVICGGRVQEERLSDHAVALIVKRRLPAGKDSAKFAGHSLRAGFVTAAANGGASIKAIMQQTGHRSLETVMRYMRDASLFRGNALGATGL